MPGVADGRAPVQELDATVCQAVTVGDPQVADSAARNVKRLQRRQPSRKVCQRKIIQPWAVRIVEHM